MKFYEIGISMTAFLLTLMIMVMPGSSLETSVLLTTEHNLSIQIGQEYLLGSRSVHQSDDGGAYQNIIINNSSDGNATNATLGIYSLSVYNDDLANMNSTTAFSEFMEDTIIGLLKLTGERLVGEETLENKIKENVTLYSFVTPQSELKPDGEAYSMAFWSIDSRNMIMLLSHLDDETNKQIIQTLEVESTRC